MTCEQCYVCEQTVLQCSRTMLLAMTYDLCHGGHMVAEYPLLHTPAAAIAANNANPADPVEAPSPASSFMQAMGVLHALGCPEFQKVCVCMRVFACL